MADDIRSRARIPQRRVQVSAPVFQPAGDEQQRLFTAGEETPKTTEADIARRVAEQDASGAEDQKVRFQRIQDMYTPKAQPKVEGEQPPEVEALDKEIEGTPTVVEGETKPPGSFEESPEEVKAKFRAQLQHAIEKGDIDPHEIQETIKRLGR